MGVIAALKVAALGLLAAWAGSIAYLTTVAVRGERASRKRHRDRVLATLVPFVDAPGTQTWRTR